MLAFQWLQVNNKNIHAVHKNILLARPGIEPGFLGHGPNRLTIILTCRNTKKT